MSYEDMVAEMRRNGAEAFDARRRVSHRVVSRTPIVEPAIFLDQYDADGCHVAYVGCSGDQRSARRMRRREADERGCAVTDIRFSTTGGIDHV